MVGFLMSEVPLYMAAVLVVVNVSHCRFQSDWRGTSLIGNCTYLGPYSRTIPRGLWWS